MGIHSYRYDALSRRIAKITGGVTTLYRYDGWNCIAEYTGSTLSEIRTWGLDLMSGSGQGAGGVGGLLAEKTGGTYYYPTFDGNGNVSEYLNANGDTIAHFEYDPFGNTVVNAGSVSLFNYRFSTKPLDFETGLFYYGYRYYDPVTGRWPSRDPIEERGGVNLYVFVANKAAASVDILGNASISVNEGLNSTTVIQDNELGVRMRSGHHVARATSSFGGKADKSFGYLFYVEYVGVPGKNVLARLTFEIRVKVDGNWIEDNFSYDERFTLSNNANDFGISLDRHNIPKDDEVECGTVNAYIAYGYADDQVDPNKSNFSLANPDQWDGGGGRYSQYWNSVDIEAPPPDLESLDWESPESFKTWSFSHTYKRGVDEFDTGKDSIEINFESIR